MGGSRLTGCKKRRECVMNINELAEILHSAYYGARSRDEIVALNLFGIRYANELRYIQLNALLNKAEIRLSYRDEIKKGMNLAKYVDLDTRRLWFGND